MQNNNASPRIYLAISAFVFVIFIFVLVFLIYLSIFSSPNKNGPTPSPIPLPKDLSVNYSNLNHIIPGKSTIEDVEKTNGKPERTSSFGEKTYLYYPTPFKGYENIVLLKNDVVTYALENVFGNYRGSYGSYTDSLGQPDIALYANDDPLGFPWYVFLKSGLAIRSNNNYIKGIIYFVPQDKVGFMQNVASDLKLSEQRPAGQDEFIAP